MRDLAAAQTLPELLEFASDHSDALNVRHASFVFYRIAMLSKGKHSKDIHTHPATLKVIDILLKQSPSEWDSIGLANVIWGHFALRLATRPLLDKVRLYLL